MVLGSTIFLLYCLKDASIETYILIIAFLLCNLKIAVSGTWRKVTLSGGAVIKWGKGTQDAKRQFKI